MDKDGVVCSTGSFKHPFLKTSDLLLLKTYFTSLKIQ